MMSDGIKFGYIDERLIAAMQQHSNTMSHECKIDGVISIEDALSIVDNFGPTGADVNETFQIQMVLRDKVREQEAEIANLRAQLAVVPNASYTELLLHNTKQKLTTEGNKNGISE